MKQHQVSSFRQLTHPARLILTCLHDHPMGGRELLALLAAEKCWLEPGTLWAMLSRLEQNGLISPLSPDGSWHEIRRYQVTDAGDLLLSKAWSTLDSAKARIDPRSSRGFRQGWIMILIKWIVRLYPKVWRERYEDEMIELLGAHEITFWTWLDLLWNALDAQFDPFYRRSALLSPFRRLRRGQKMLLAVFTLPLLSSLSYMAFFTMGGLHPDYWTRNEHYPILALSHALGSLGMTVTWMCALLACIVLASGGIKRFGRAGDGLVHRLILVTMCLPLFLLFTLSLRASFFPDFLGEVGNAVFGSNPWMFGGSFLLISLLLAGWGGRRLQAFRRALPSLLPWLGFHLFALTLVLGTFLSPPSENPTQFYQPIALLCLLSTPLSFAVALVRLRLGKQLRSILLLLATVGTLSMMLVQLMMIVRVITLHFLQLSTVWTNALIVELVLNVLFTALALVFVFTLLPGRRSSRNAPPTNPFGDGR